MADRGAIGVAATALRHGDRVTVRLDLDIPPGTHIEAHEPLEPFFIPTVAEFVNLDVHEVRYPDPVPKPLPGIPGPPLLVYEGRVTVTAEGTTADDVVHGTIHFQPCVGGACLPPRSQLWSMQVSTAV
jgi:uncharacterized protein